MTTSIALRRGALLITSALFAGWACGDSALELMTGGDAAPSSAEPPSPMPGSGAADAGSGPALLVDDAAATAVTFPAKTTCRQAATATIELKNTGTTAWRIGDYALRASTGADPFNAAGIVALSVEVGPGATVRFDIPLRGPASAGAHTSSWRMARGANGWFGPSIARTVQVDCPSNRTPDPAPGSVLPLPDMFSVVKQVHDADPLLIKESCIDEGGKWKFMDAVVDKLREYDTRWGYNWKRMRIGVPSHDAIDYHFSAGPDEGSTDVYVLDIIGGHCGPNPQPAWIDVTLPIEQGGAGAMWTGRGRFGPVVHANIRASTGHFLSAEDGGGSAVNANRLQALAWERFTVDDVNGGDVVSGDEIRLRTSSGAHYVRAAGGAVSATSTTSGAAETFTVIRLAGAGPISSGSAVAFKTPAGTYVSAENGGGAGVIATATAIGPWETFTVSVP